MDAFKNIKNESYQQSKQFLTWLARAHIMSGNPEAAWNLYLQLSSKHAREAMDLVRLVADECYGMGHFLHSAKAFQACFCLELMSVTPSGTSCTLRKLSYLPIATRQLWHR